MIRFLLEKKKLGILDAWKHVTNRCNIVWTKALLWFEPKTCKHFNNNSSCQWQSPYMQNIAAWWGGSNAKIFKSHWQHVHHSLTRRPLFRKQATYSSLFSDFALAMASESAWSPQAASTATQQGGDYSKLLPTYNISKKNLLNIDCRVCCF